jgi:hypothetical protein
VSDERKTPAEYVADHVRELADIHEQGKDGKRLIGLVTLACYGDGLYYPHASGLIDHARALGITQTFLIGLTMADHERWARSAIERRILERGL